MKVRLHLRKGIIILLAAALLAGCARRGEGQASRPPAQETDKPDGTAAAAESRGASVTPLELKEKYQQTDGNQIMPLYNVDKSEVFTFHFKTDFNEWQEVNPWDVISVHTDGECLDKSKMECIVEGETEEGGTAITVSPLGSLNTERDRKRMTDDGEETWGSLPMLYRNSGFRRQGKQLKRSLYHSRLEASI